MVSEKVVVVLIILAIVMSLLSIAVTISTLNSDLIPPNQKEIRTIREIGNKESSGGSGIGIQVVK